MSLARTALAQIREADGSRADVAGKQHGTLDLTLKLAVVAVRDGVFQARQIAEA
jgi:hypothetical protein